MTKKAQRRTPGRVPKDTTRQLNVRITQEASDLLDAVLVRDGVGYQAQIERAIRLWAASKGIEVPHGTGKGEA